MISAHTVAQVRAAEDRLRAVLPPGTLMQRAATGLAVACAERLGRVYGARVLLLVGGGDNGADALHAGARLARRGAAVTAVLTGEPVADALAALRAAGGRVGELGPADLVVDGLVGIGGRGGLRPAAAALAAQVVDHDVVAVDLPSGVDADTGEVAGAAVRADLTLVFGTCKPGLLVGAGRTLAGRVELVDIGLGPELPPPPVELLEPSDVARLLPRGSADSDKYTRGVVGIAAGSQTYPGAAVLSVGSALAAGAGMVRFAGAPHAAEQVRSRWPEAVVTEHEGSDVPEAGRVQAWVVGPGLGTDERAAATVEALLGTDVPVLVDADALTVCAAHPDWLRRRSAPTLLTPHDREFARFGTPVTADRIGSARRLAAELGVTVLLKGDATVVTDPTGPARVNGTGSPALATAGSGDVLSGGCGALLAQGLSAIDAGSTGAHLHGRAGALAARGVHVPASALLAHWADAVREVDG
ncbi:MAG: NAD(P)H-hydrate epimerase / ADP-dependent (S)-NAD(P)H-hydrate dehydratase [uncultured Frankineae bacterium]|uniref:Bifunctional NAD(P)H-hydrate repair enzyme n=1 Tax=uncultured Frankineae bacterium TaxID=437475 RepID=A0A6J4M475_9ACTN|nr:MAG: NAD(P)H-hydrate epimerase / ADP-dependent (S)-NAD(P)H-hydrate dehydratase [uncultured Frankineae bacterium]